MKIFFYFIFYLIEEIDISVKAHDKLNQLVESYCKLCRKLSNVAFIVAIRRQLKEINNFNIMHKT